MPNPYDELDTVGVAGMESPFVPVVREGYFPMLSGIADLDARLRSGDGHPLLGTGSIHASMIEGGQVVFGPIVGGLHGVEEWVDLASLERCYDAYLAVASELCA